MSAVPVFRRFTVADYYRMAAAGILGAHDRVELVDGRVVQMTPIGPDHAGCVKAVADVLRRTLGDTALLGVQDPITLDAASEPQPDVTVLRRLPGGYRVRHPGPADILLVVEVADTSLAYDRDVKAPLYARAGIPEVWLVVLAESRIVVYREPGPEGYADMRTVTREGSLSPVAFPGATIPAADVLG